MTDKKLLKIFTIEKEHEFIMPLITETLSENNIDYHLKNMHDTAYDGLFVGQKGVGYLYVFEDDKERAMAIIQDLIEQNID